jgi:hypothetical protein
MTEQEVQAMLATANAQAGATAVANVDDDGNVNVSAPEATPNTPNEDGVIKGVKPAQPTPEEAVALMDKIEGKESNSVEPTTTEEPVSTEDPEVDITTLPLEEQIAKLQEKLDAQNGVEKAPLSEVEAKLSEANLDLKDYEKMYLEQGSLDAETLESLKKAGFNKTAVDAYISTRVAQEKQRSSQAINDVMGSQDNFEAMSKWMVDTLNESELEAYNKGVSSEHYKVYLSDMYARYSKANPPAQTIVRQRGVQTTQDASNTYSSTAEMIGAMRDRRYGKDPQYTQEVRAKVSRMPK